METDPLAALPESIRMSARVDGGEHLWHRDRAVGAIEALAAAGHRVLGLDIRDYDGDGRFTEIAWLDCSSVPDVVGAREAAMAALVRSELPGTWVLITWS